MNADFSQNKLYRGLLFPPIMAFRLMRRFMYAFTEDSKKLKQLKNSHVGKRCFIIGNGPSLTVRDLEKLENEVTFATNRIYSIFEDTKWRPNYYLAIDNNILKDNIENIEKVECEHKFINITSKAYGIKKDNNTTFINMFGPYLINPCSYETKRVCRDVSKSFTLSYSVTGVAIELAIYMGFNEIYLIGVDNSYSNSIDKNGKILRDDSVKDYFGKLKSKSYTIQYSDATNSYYKAFRTYAEKNGIKIYNSTRGGKLEVFERKEFDKLFL